ncbi:hypothetical protein ACJMK2_002951 [Sinanodonta woodiana]|uniref:Uncharacterized protein n=1 Tax=Sinanodonta woodiana TaxID=1069815 RepID=A0ABD3XYL6_SINWO
MVNTVSNSFYLSLSNKPVLRSLESLGLEVTIADGSLLNYLGNIKKCPILIPFVSDFKLSVPILVVPDTGSDLNCPGVIVTNAIRLCRDYMKDNPSANRVPDAWDIAIDSIKCKPLTVRSTNMHAVNVEPYETVTINGIARNVDAGISEIVAENLENSIQVTICLRVVTVDHQGTSSQIKVRLCNMSAKCVTIKPNSDICLTSVDNLAFDFTLDISKDHGQSPHEI